MDRRWNKNVGSLVSSVMRSIIVNSESTRNRLSTGLRSDQLGELKMLPSPDFLAGSGDGSPGTGKGHKEVGVKGREKRGRKGVKRGQTALQAFLFPRFLPW